MPTFMITLLPPQPASLEAIEFMQKKNLSYQLSSDVNIFDVLMTCLRRKSGLATALGPSEDFEPGKEELQIIKQFCDIFKSDKKIKIEELDENSSPEQFQSVVDFVRVKVEVDEHHENVVSPPVEHNRIEENLSGAESEPDEPTGDGISDSLESDDGDLLHFHGHGKVKQEPLPVNNNGHYAAFDVSLEEEEEELNQEEEDEDDDENVNMDVENSSERVDDKDERDDSDDDEDYEEASEDEQEKGNSPVTQKNTKNGARSRVVWRLLFPCPVKNCPSSYKTFAELEKHVKGHSACKEDFFCNVCKYGFTSLDDALEHIRDREKKKCCKCEKNCPDRNAFIRHLRRHTDELPFICAECNKGFKQTSELKIHETTHSGDKPFECDQCHHKFARNSDLGRHLKTHTGTKKFKCGECELSFSRSYHLKQHELKEHLREEPVSKPYSCKQCKRSFCHLDSLENHELQHSGVLPFKCDECDSSFTHKYFLTNHKKENHLRNQQTASSAIKYPVLTELLNSPVL